jgi:hypothetical protein
MGLRWGLIVSTKRARALICSPILDNEPVPSETFSSLAYMWQRRIKAPWYARCYANAFDAVAQFVLFIGYPRSGHSLVGALLDAHPDAWIAHELNVFKYLQKGCGRNVLFGKLIARGKWFRTRAYRWTGYSYHVPGQWQGHWRRPLVIGDKRGGASARQLARSPDLLDRLEARIDKPLRIIHVVRNPYDNISTRARGGNLQRASPDQAALQATIDAHFRDVATNAEVETRWKGATCRLHYESFAADPKAELARVCRFLELDPSPDYLEAAASLVRPSSGASRHQVAWTPAQLEEVAAKSQGYPFLAHYRFEAP